MQSSENSLWRFFSLLRHSKRNLLFTIIAALVFVFARTAVPVLIGDFVGDIFTTQVSLTLKTVGLLLGFAVLWALSQYLMFLFSGFLAVKLTYRLRSSLYKKIVRLPSSYFGETGSSSLLSVSSNDITLIESFLSVVMAQLIANPLTVIAIVAYMFFMNWQFALYFFILGPVILGIMALIGNQVQRLGHSIQSNIADITKIFSETLRHIFVIKAYNSEQIETDRFLEKNDQHLSLSRKEMATRLVALPASDLMGIFSVIFLLSMGALGIEQGLVSVDEVTRFVAMAIVLSDPISATNQMIVTVRRLGSAVDRIFNVLDAPVEQESDLESIGTLDGSVSFKNINFSYNKDRQVLHDVSLDIASKESIAIVGISGSGKSTLASLMLKFYEAQSGELLFNGKNASQYSASSIRDHIAFVSQDTSLFSDSIFNNINLSRPEATKEDIISAAKLAHAHDFIISFPQGYETQVSEGGTNMSGGERQRIILARAILRQPEILILDEPTSALDSHSEAQVVNTLQDIYGLQTTIVISHKLKFISALDRIVVMADGKIIETGSHKELLALNGAYHGLWMLQS